MPKVQERISSRPPWERMMHIHEQLKGQEFPNCSSISRDIEVSTRTIKRDIDFMKYRLDLPIEYDDRKYGFYYSKPVENFPSLPVTEAEVFALLVAHKAVAQYKGTPYEKPLDAAFQKLTNQLDGQAKFSLGSLDEALSFRPYAPGDADLKIFQVLTQALQGHRAIKFNYKNLGARIAQKRHVHPCHLACIQNHWYLFAFDVNRKAMRTFVLSRLSDLELTKEKFKPRDDFDPDEYLKGSFTVFKGKEDYEVVIDFDVWATDLIRGRKWHPTQQFTELPNGSSSLQIRLNNIEEMEQWVLSWGLHATVIRPAELANRIRKTAVGLIDRYPNAQKNSIAAPLTAFV
ncbi:MAG: WYL domain-containing protein [Verrucomicrobiota bacterium]